RDIEELKSLCGFADFDRWGLAAIQQKRVEGIAAVKNHSKLMILGKPGAGKTTFLKFLAMSCINGNDFADLVPVFVTLKDFADTENTSGLLAFISRQAEQYGIVETTQVNRGFFDYLFNRDTNATETLLRKGKILVLLDGLDEVREKDDDRVLKEIQEFSRKYSQTQIIVTCRIAAKQYIFEQFTEVEVADFDEQQIATFAGNWFRQKEIKAEDFLAELDQNSRVQELATSPLLLTLLCLAFEESGTFPANRAELYKEGLDALLRKWDAKRGIRRDSVYKDLSVQKKEDMLSQIALATFEKGDYFVKQRQLEDYICDYIRNTANAKTNPEELHLDSEAVLKSIEAQHGLFVERARGIYSFSHLTFHEYFAARQLVVSTSPSKLAAALQNLVSHITDKRWREVILLAVGMAREADDLLLLMKKQIDSLLAGDEKLQSFLAWVDEKSRSVNAPYKLTAVRAYYFALAGKQELDFAHSIDLTIDLDYPIDLDHRYILPISYSYGFSNVIPFIDHGFSDRRDPSVERRFIFSDVPVINFAMYQQISDERLIQRLRDLKDRMPDPNQDWNYFIKCWEENRNQWITEYCQVLIEERNIGHDWQFTEEQKEKLKQYYEANKLLVECMQSDCYVRVGTRQEIEAGLLLPVK
ncbi:MAG: NACHT domain-containing protein, partial [Pseudanabaenaceae cyanobacterium]